ncbi:glycosyl hydrolase [Klebsiella aerogenes]
MAGCLQSHLPNPFYAGNNPGTGEGGLKKAIRNDKFAAILQGVTGARAGWTGSIKWHRNCGIMVCWCYTSRLYQDVFSYFVNTKGLTNLLWVFSPDASLDHKTAYYPDAGYVGIASLDFYTDNPASLSDFDEMLGLNKTFGLVEVGPSTTNGQYDYAALMNTIPKNFPKTIIFVPWNDVGVR